MTQAISDLHHAVTIGRLGSPYGIRGWLRLSSFTNPVENIISYSEFWVARQHGWQHCHIEQGKAHNKNRFIVKIREIDTRNCASQYVNCTVAIPRETLPKLPEEEHYCYDMLGMAVITRAGDSLGHVKSLIETTAHDIFVVLGERERLIPYTDETVVSIDTAQKVLTVDWDLSF